jgi:hypothetical protein
MMGGYATAAGITDTTQASLKLFAANKMASWVRDGHPLIDGSPMYEEMKALLE